MDRAFVVATLTRQFSLASDALAKMEVNRIVVWSAKSFSGSVELVGTYRVTKTAFGEYTFYSEGAQNFFTNYDDYESRITTEGYKLLSDKNMQLSRTLIEGIEALVIEKK